jgi:hypothetical protein
MGSMTNDFLEAKKLFPNARTDDLIEASIYARNNGTTLMDYAHKVQAEDANLKKLEKALGIYEVATMLMDLAGPEAVGTALSRIEERERASPTLRFAINNPHYNYNHPTTGEEDEEMDQELEVELIAAYDAEDSEAISELLEKIKHKHKIKMGLHRIKVSDSRSPVNATSRRFSDIVAEPMKVFKAITKESDDRYIDLTNESLDINEGAVNVLRASIVKKTAADTIRANGRPSDADVQSMMPHEAPAIRAVGSSDIDTRKALSGTEFAIEPTVDQSFGAIAKRTKAAASIARPSKIDFKDQEDDSQLPSYWKREKAANTAANVPASSTYKKHPNQQPQYAVDLRNLASPRPDGT